MHIGTSIEFGHRISKSRRDLPQFRIGKFSTDSANLSASLSPLCHKSASAGTGPGAFAFGGTPVIQTLKLRGRIMRYELDDYEGAAIKSMLPYKPRGVE
jgi:hypothetical protein